MTKLSFLLCLRERLSHLPQDEVEERLSFYSEMIEDRVEEGLSEEDAVAAVGDVETVAVQIASQIPVPATFVGKTKRKRQVRAWEIVLLVLGAPLWLSLLIAAAAVVIALYAALWAVLVSLWSVFGSLAACAVGGILSCVGLALGGYGFIGVALLGAGLICAGLAVFAFYGCNVATKGVWFLTKLPFSRKRRRRKV